MQRAIFIGFFICIFSGAGYLSAKLPAKLTINNRDKIFKCLLKNPYPYMFHPKLPPTKGQHPKNLTKYTGGTNGILWYASLSNCIGGPSKKWADLKPMETALGFKLTRPNDTWLSKTYRTEVIYWAMNNLIPQPNEKLYGVSYQTIYDKSTSFFFRRMATTYKYLMAKQGRLAQETSYYRSIMGKDFLENYYKRYGKLYKTDPLLAGFAIGFWIRRSADSTRPVLWQALQKVLQMYDPEWYNQNALAALPE